MTPVIPAGLADLFAKKTFAHLATLMPDGRLLVFEANPTMLVHPEIIDGPLAHKNAYVRSIYDAFEGLLGRAAALR